MSYKPGREVDSRDFGAAGAGIGSALIGFGRAMIDARRRGAARVHAEETYESMAGFEDRTLRDLRSLIYQIKDHIARLQDSSTDPQVRAVAATGKPAYELARVVIAEINRLGKRTEGMVKRTFGDRDQFIASFISGEVTDASIMDFVTSFRANYYRALEFFSAQLIQLRSINPTVREVFKREEIYDDIFALAFDRIRALALGASQLH